MLDRLHLQRAAIEAALAKREQELFGLDGVVLPAADSSVLRARKASTPEPVQRPTHTAVGLPSETIAPRRAWSRPPPSFSPG